MSDKEIKKNDRCHVAVYYNICCKNNRGNFIPDKFLAKSGFVAD